MGKKAPLQAKKSLHAAIAVGFAAVLLVIAGIGVAGLANRAMNQQAEEEQRFFQALQEFDVFLTNAPGIVSATQINRAFDDLEKKALSAESLLSVLKRRRILAQTDGDTVYIAAYRESAQKAAARYPGSEPLALTAAEAVLMDKEETSAKYGGSTFDAAYPDAESLRSYAARLSDARYKPSALSIYVLLGDLNDPVRASSIPHKEMLFPESLSSEKLAIDGAILNILGGDITSATVRVNELLKTSNSSYARDFAAQFFYDYDRPLRAAEIFAQSNEEKDLIRAADALYLSGNVESARSHWTLLSSSDNSAFKMKSLYNLAATESDSTKTAAYLTQLTASGAPVIDASSDSAPYMVYGAIKYSRLLSPANAEQNLSSLTKIDPLIELEILRRNRELWTPEKTAAQTWLLLNKHPSDARLYEWAGWLFDFQRQPKETDWLVQNATYNNITGSWLDLIKGIALMENGDFDAAYEQFMTVPSEYSYAASANIARILESRYSTKDALSYYETAVKEDSKNKKTAAHIQYRMSRCFHLLGRDAESKAALEKALELDPEYLAAQSELKRLESL